MFKLALSFACTFIFSVLIALLVSLLYVLYLLVGGYLLLFISVFLILWAGMHSYLNYYENQK